jgi:hypothetical protein
VLGGVAVGARLTERTSVRFVAARALLVTRRRARVNGGMAALAADAQSRGPVRQTAVTTVARRVTRKARDTGQLLGVAVLAHAALCDVQEGVRGVALLTRDSPVKISIRRRQLMTRATVPRESVRARLCGMRVVTADARARDTALRMVGVHLSMAGCAGFFGRAAHVVGGVARRAAVVGGNARRRERVAAFVARLTTDRGATIELMGTVTTYALCVAPGEERRGRNLRLMLGVALTATPERCRRGGVLVFVTGRAHFRRASPVRGVRSGHVFVTRNARSRPG